MNINLSDFTVEREAIIGFVVFKNAKEGQIICSPLTFNKDGFRKNNEYWIRQYKNI